MLNSLPIEIIIIIAENSHTVWFSLSMTMKQFGLYSILPHNKKQAMKRFHIKEVDKFSNNCYKHYFTLNQKIHGAFHSRTHPTFWLNEEIFCWYRNGLRHGECRVINDRQLVATFIYEYDVKRQSNYFVNGYLRSSYYYDKNGKLQNSLFYSDPTLDNLSFLIL